MTDQQTAAIQSLIAANPTFTDDQIQAVCAADFRTITSINLSDLRALLATMGLIGALQLAATNAAIGAQTQAAILSALAYVNSPNTVINSDQPTYAALFNQMLTMFAGASLITSDQQAQIIALGGGYLIAGTQTADVTTTRSAMTAQAAIDSAVATATAWNTAQEAIWNQYANDWGVYLAALQGGNLSATQPAGLQRTA